MVTRILLLAVLALALGILSPRPVFASYVDPNTGGMLFQLLGFAFAFLSGLMLFFAAQIRRALGRVRRLWGSLGRREASE
jgi:hypothetical protein